MTYHSFIIKIMCAEFHAKIMMFSGIMEVHPE